MKLSGSIIITNDNSEIKPVLQFFPNGEVLYVTGDQKTRISYLEAKQQVDRYGCTTAGGNFTCNDIPVKYTNFLSELCSIRPREAFIKDEDYVEKHIEHIPVEERHGKKPEPEDVPQQENFWS